MHGAGTAIRNEVRTADHVWETLASGLRMECGIPHQLWAMRGWDSILAVFLTSEQVRSCVEAGLLVIDDVSIRTSLKGGDGARQYLEAAGQRMVEVACRD